jgi:hypothetical protein
MLEALSREARSRLGGGGALGRAGEGARVYRGRTVEELIPRIERELGADAIILRRREGLAGGVFGFFQRQYVEIEAMPGAPGIDVYDEADSTPPPSYEPVSEAMPAAQPPAVAALAPLRTAEPARAPEALRAPEPPPPSPAPAAPAAPVGGPYVTAHLAALARAGAPPSSFTLPPRAAPERRPRAPEPVDFQDLLPRELAPLEPSRRAFEPVRPAFQVARPAFEAEAPRPSAERRTVAPGSHARARAGVQKSLRRFGVSEELAVELIEAAIAHTLPLAPRAGLAKAVRMAFAERIPIAEPLPTAGAAIVLVGAGGAGKTTCCATLLEAYRSGSSLSASYATLLRSPTQGQLQMLLSPQLMKPTAAGTPKALRALKRARVGGLAVIDTPSVSPADRGAIRELGQLLGELAPERIVVALPVTLGAAAARQLLEALEPLGAHALALTHADETDQIGVAIEAACRFGLAPEYMLDRARSGPWRLSRIDPPGLAARLLQ